MTEHPQLRSWLDEVEIPAGLESELLAGVRQRRRARGARTAALALSTACLVAAGAAVWHRPDVRSTQPAIGGECQAALPPGYARIANGLEARVTAPVTVRNSGSLVASLALHNTGDRAVPYQEVHFESQVCAVLPDGSEQAIEGMISDSSVDLGGGARRIEPDSAQAGFNFFNFRPCRSGEDADQDECSSGPLPPGSYRIHGSVRVDAEGGPWYLVAVPATVLVTG